MSEIGMDPNAVLALASVLDRQKQAIEQVGTAIDRAVAQARSCWRGSDVGRFASHWSSHRAQMRSASSAIGELAAKARTNAHQQIATSNDYSGLAGATGSFAGGGIAAGVGTTGSGTVESNGSRSQISFEKGTHTQRELNIFGLRGHQTGFEGGKVEAGAHAGADENSTHAEAHAHAFVGAKAEQRFSKSIGSLEQALTTKEQVGSEAKGAASVSLAPHEGASARAEFSVINGAKETADSKFETPLGGGHLGGSLIEGNGAGGLFEISLTKNRVGIDAGLAFADELGVGLQAGAHINPTAIEHAVGPRVVGGAQEVERRVRDAILHPRPPF